MAICAGCNKEVHESRLVMSGRGIVCPECSLVKVPDTRPFREMRLTVWSGPVLAGAFTLVGCLFTVCSGIGGPLVCAFGGVFVIGYAILMLYLTYNLMADYTATTISPATKRSLVVSSVISGLWGLLLLGYGLSQGLGDVVGGLMFFNWIFKL